MTTAAGYTGRQTRNPHDDGAVSEEACANRGGRCGCELSDGDGSWQEVMCCIDCAELDGYTGRQIRNPNDGVAVDGEACVDRGGQCWCEVSDGEAEWSVQVCCDDCSQIDGYTGHQVPSSGNGDERPGDPCADYDYDFYCVDGDCYDDGADSCCPYDRVDEDCGLDDDPGDEDPCADYDYEYYCVEDDCYDDGADPCCPYDRVDEDCGLDDDPGDEDPCADYDYGAYCLADDCWDDSDGICCLFDVVAEDC